MLFHVFAVALCGPGFRVLEKECPTLVWGYTEGLARFLFLGWQYLSFSRVADVFCGEAYGNRSARANSIRICSDDSVPVPLDYLEVSDIDVRVAEGIVCTRLKALAGSLVKVELSFFLVGCVIFGVYRNPRPFSRERGLIHKEV